MENITSYLTTNTSIWNVFRYTLENSFLGNWTWLLLLLLVDIAIFIKTRNMVLTGFINTVVAYVFMNYLPPNTFLFMLVFTAGAIAIQFVQYYR